MEAASAARSFRVGFAAAGTSRRCGRNDMRPAQRARKGERKVRMTSGKRGEQRSSALWGTGNRGGETRSNALWGKGGRGFVTALVAMLAISVPLAASSDGKNAYTPPDTYVSPVLKHLADGKGNPKIPVIITADATLDTSLGAVKSLLARSGLGVNKNLGLVNGISLDLPVKKIDAYQRRLHLEPALAVRVGRLHELERPHGACRRAKRASDRGDRLRDPGGSLRLRRARPGERQPLDDAEQLAG